MSAHVVIIAGSPSGQRTVGRMDKLKDLDAGDVFICNGQMFIVGDMLEDGLCWNIKESCVAEFGPDTEVNVMVYADNWYIGITSQE